MTLITSARRSSSQSCCLRCEFVGLANQVVPRTAWAFKLQAGNFYVCERFKTFRPLRLLCPHRDPLFIGGVAYRLAGDLPSYRAMVAHYLFRIVFRHVKAALHMEHSR